MGSRKKTNTVGLTLNWIDGPESEFPSFEELEKADFPASLINGNVLLPASFTAKQLFSPLGETKEKDKDTLISTFEINSIRGALIIGLAVHHSCSDGLSVLCPPTPDLNHASSHVLSLPLILPETASSALMTPKIH